MLSQAPVDHLLELFVQGRMQDVLAASGVLIAKQPLAADPYQIRAMALARTGNTSKALDGYRRALIAAPGHHVAHYNYANTLRGLNDADPAIAHYRRAIAVSAGFSEAHNNLGLLLRAAGDRAAARQCFEKAIRFGGPRAEYLVNLAQTLVELGENDGVAERCRKALAIEPAHVGGWAALGSHADAGGRDDDAIRYNDRALAVAPGLSAVRSNSGLIKLRLGRFRDGWADYRERRQPTVDVRNPDGAPVPRWSGGPVRGARLLLWCEQGIGDQVMFLTLVPHLLRAGASVSLVLEDRLIDLSRRWFPQAGIIREREILGQPVLGRPVDAWTFLGDLPGQLDLFCGGEAAPEHTLAPDPGRAAALRRGLLDRHPGQRLVGITWRSISPITGPPRTIAPALWRPVLAVPGCAFVSLQYGAVPADADAFRQATGHCPDFAHGVQPMTDLDGLVALIDAVDLVVCPTNSTVHFAGAMGKPGWILLQNRADWRWGIRSDRSRWYPSLRLYRQQLPGDWSPVMAAVARDLEGWAAAGGPVSRPGE